MTLFPFLLPLDVQQGKAIFSSFLVKPDTPHACQSCPPPMRSHDERSREPRLASRTHWPTDRRCPAPHAAIMRPRSFCPYKWRLNASTREKGGRKQREIENEPRRENEPNKREPLINPNGEEGKA